MDFKRLTKSNAAYNLQQAFNTAEQQLGLAKLLDPEGEIQIQPLRVDVTGVAQGFSTYRSRSCHKVKVARSSTYKGFSEACGMVGARHSSSGGEDMPCIRLSSCR